MLIHSGERPFKCKICNMAFTTNGNMHRHIRTHGVASDCDLLDNNNNYPFKVKKKKCFEDPSKQTLSSCKVNGVEIDNSSKKKF